MKNPEYIFIGGTYRGYKLLEALLLNNYIPSYLVVLKEDDHEVDKYSNNIIQLATAKNINYSVKKKLNSIDFEIIKSREFDFALVCGWRTIIPDELNKQFRMGMLAAHDSLLPKYRGFSPLNWAIINGEKETGVTLFRINEGEVDSGDIIEQEKVTIESLEYAIDVYEKVTQATISVHLKFLTDFKNGTLNFSKQLESEATYTCKRSPADGKVNWNKSSEEIFNFIRALAHPYPGAFCEYGGKKYHIRKAALGKNNSKKYSGKIVGRVISVQPDYIEVMCGEGTINITQWEDKENGIVESPSVLVKSIVATLL